jgi:hypothetical protein
MIISLQVVMIQMFLFIFEATNQKIGVLYPQTMDLKAKKKKKEFASLETTLVAWCY